MEASKPGLKNGQPHRSREDIASLESLFAESHANVCAQDGLFERAAPIRPWLLGVVIQLALMRLVIFIRQLDGLAIRPGVQIGGAALPACVEIPASRRIEQVVHQAMMQAVAGFARTDGTSTQMLQTLQGPITMNVALCTHAGR